MSFFRFGQVIIKRVVLPFHLSVCLSVVAAFCCTVSLHKANKLQ